MNLMVTPRQIFYPFSMTFKKEWWSFIYKKISLYNGVNYYANINWKDIKFCKILSYWFFMWAILRYSCYNQASSLMTFLTVKKWKKNCSWQAKQNKFGCLLYCFPFMVLISLLTLVSYNVQRRDSILNVG